MFADRVDAALETFYSDVWRPMWLDACLMDQVSTANHLGVFVDSLRFTWFIPQLPRHPVFDAITKKMVRQNQFGVAEVAARRAGPHRSTTAQRGLKMTRKNRKT